MQTKTICYKGKFYERIAFCFFVGAKMQVALCSIEKK